MSRAQQNELLKAASAYLRGTIAEGLEPRSPARSPRTTPSSPSSTASTCRTTATCARSGARSSWSRPSPSWRGCGCRAGSARPQQWLQMDQIADRLRQRHAAADHAPDLAVPRRDQAEPAAHACRRIDQACLDTIAACGDVNRNVMCTPNPHVSQAHAEALELARAISDHLLPKTRAYREIWLEGEKIAGGEAEDEPIYGKTYLPRKFKTVVAVPPDNDVDVFAHDLGFIAILDEDGGVDGLERHRRRRHGHDPRRARHLPAHRRRHGLLPARAGGRRGREGGAGPARLRRPQPTASTRGSNTPSRTAASPGSAPRSSGAWATRSRTRGRSGSTHTGDRYGWAEDRQGDWHFTLFVENGRVKDTPERPMRTGLRKIAEVHKGEFRLTPNQNLIIASVKKRDRKQIEALLHQHGLGNDRSGPAAQRDGLRGAADLRPGPGRERALPAQPVDALEEILDEAGLRQDEIVIRMTGCPNGCARPYLAEIGLVGRGPGSYHLYLGAAFDGTRLNKLYRQDVGHDEIVAALSPLLARLRRPERRDGERFGDFVVRTGVVRRDPQRAGLPRRLMASVGLAFLDRAGVTVRPPPRPRAGSGQNVPRLTLGRSGRFVGLRLCLLTLRLVALPGGSSFLRCGASIRLGARGCGLATELAALARRRMRVRLAAARATLIAAAALLVHGRPGPPLRFLVSNPRLS